MVNKILTNFIKEARKRGFSDIQIRNEMDKKGWPILEGERAFLSLEKKPKYKNQITLFLSNDIVNKLQKRATKNLFTLPEQVEDILRRSCMNKKTTPKEEKIDDKLLLAFSRKKK